MMNHVEQREVREDRAVSRYFLNPPLVAVFANIPVAIADFGERGVQVEHPNPLKVGTVARLSFPLPNRATVELNGFVVWSRLSQKPDATGKLLYRSGIRIDEQVDVARDALRRLLDTSIAHPDMMSLEIKKKLVAEKERERAARPVMKPIVVPRKPDIDPDQLLLIQHAHDQLKTHPDEAIKWYNRAKFSLTAAGFVQAHYREDVLAVWEYLGRTIDLAIIAKVFEGKK